MPHLVAIYGPPLSGKSSLAHGVAAGLDGKTATVGVDALLDEAIRVHDEDPYAELDMVLTQTRLLVANYLKNGYHVVVEGAFCYERAGFLHRHEQQIDQMLGLMRNLAPLPLIVRLRVSEEGLRRRASEASPARDAEAALRVDAAYAPRPAGRRLVLDSGEMPVEGMVDKVLAALAE